MNTTPTLRRRCDAPSLIATLLSAALLVACGGGGDANVPATSATIASKAAGFGSIVVDGVYYDAFTEGDGSSTVAMVAAASAAVPETAQKSGDVNEKSSSVASIVTVKWTLKSLSVRTNGVPNVFSVKPDADGVSRVSFSKGQAGLLKVGAAIAGFGRDVSLFTMSGPYGTESAFTVRGGATSTGFGQYFNTPQAVAGAQTYLVKGFDQRGQQRVELKLLINLTE